MDNQEVLEEKQSGEYLKRRVDCVSREGSQNVPDQSDDACALMFTDFECSLAYLPNRA